MEFGTRVVAKQGDKEVNGYVESEALHPKHIVNVRITQPGHPSHCLILPFDPEDVTPGSMIGSDAESRKVPEDVTKEDLEGFAKHVARQVNGFDTRLTDLAFRITALEEKAAAPVVADPPAPADPAADAATPAPTV